MNEYITMREVQDLHPGTKFVLLYTWLENTDDNIWMLNKRQRIVNSDKRRLAYKIKSGSLLNLMVDRVKENTKVNRQRITKKMQEV